MDDLIENYNKLADSLNRPRFIENKTQTVSINNEKETVHNDGEIIIDAKVSFFLCAFLLSSLFCYHELSF